MSKNGESEFLTPEDVARETAGALSVDYQKKARMRPVFIPYVRVGKKVLYRRTEYRAYMEARTRKHTRDAGTVAAA
jgi:hypothetical protein